MRFLIKEMNIDDSFLIPEGDKKSTGRSVAFLISKRIGIKIITRKVIVTKIYEK